MCFFNSRAYKILAAVLFFTLLWPGIAVVRAYGDSSCDYPKIACAFLAAPGDPEPEAGQHSVYSEYYEIIRQRIQARIEHSKNGSRLEGTVNAVFTLSPDGRLLGIKNGGSDALPAVVKYTILSIKKARPFPPFPDVFGKSPITFTLNVRYAVK